MDYRYLGRSALKVSSLCPGAMMFAGETDEATSRLADCRNRVSSIKSSARRLLGHVRKRIRTELDKRQSAATA